MICSKLIMLICSTIMANACMAFLGGTMIFSMNVLLIYLSFFARIQSKDAQVTATVKANEVVNLTVYYETLCPFSRLFILKQLEPNFMKFKDHLKMILVPYGIVKKSQQNGKTILLNQHGPLERKLNILSTCAFYQVAKDEMQILKFAKCLAWKPAETEPEELRCAKLANLSWNELQECRTNATLVAKLELEMEKKTEKGIAIPKTNLVAVPSIHINDVRYMAAYNNLQKVLCESLKDYYPEICL